MKNRKIVGEYFLGLRPVVLIVDNMLQGGEVILTPESGPSQIIIGIDIPEQIAMATLLHEIYELLLIDLNTRYTPNPGFSHESSDFIFVATHNELGEAHERAGKFLVDTMPDFMIAYDKYSKFEE